MNKLCSFAFSFIAMLALVAMALLAGCKQENSTSSTPASPDTTTKAPPPAEVKEAVKEAIKDPEVAEAIKAFQDADSSLENLFKTSVGYVVFPTAGKGGFIVGGAHGTGQVYAGGKLIGTAKMTQVTVGAQIGGQAFAELIFFETKDALDKFKEGGYSMSAQVSAVAATEGASSKAKYVEGVMVFTKSKAGLMAEASVGGQKFTFEPLAP